MVITQQIREYQTLIQACQLAEQSLAAVSASRQLLWKRKREEGNSKGKKDKEVNKGKSTILECETCGKFHIGECYKNKRTCFICQKPGHLSWKCSNKDLKQAEEDKKKNQMRGQVYMLNAEEVDHSKDLIQGMGLI